MKRTLMYNIGNSLGKFFLCCNGGISTVGIENIPDNQAVIIMPNHVSYLDPSAVGAYCKRQVFFMAKSELFKYPILGDLLRSVGAFPVSRGTADRASIKKAFELLKDNRVLNIFPEGRRSEDGNLNSIQKGAVMIALKSKAVVIPVAVIGSEKCLSAQKKGFHRCKVKVVYGKPLVTEDLLDLDSNEAFAVFSIRWTEAVNKMKETGRPVDEKLINNCEL